MRRTLWMGALMVLAAAPLAAQDTPERQERQQRQEREVRARRGAELSAEQREKIATMRERFAEEDRAIRRATRERAEARRTQLDGVLTAEQRQTRSVMRQRIQRATAERQRVKRATAERQRVVRQRAARPARPARP